MMVAGFGYQSDATPEDLHAALELIAFTPEALTSIQAKTNGPLAELADALNLPLIALRENEIAGVATPTNSSRITSRFATGSLAEATALVAAGPGAQLIIPRQTTANGKATIALAQGPRI